MRALLLEQALRTLLRWLATEWINKGLQGQHRMLRFRLGDQEWEILLEIRPVQHPPA